MKNIHVIPTDKPSRLSKSTSKEELTFCSDIYNLSNRQHIYITSDKDKEGDWVISIYQGLIKVSDKELKIKGYVNGFCSKIILTTDPELIKDGIQAIDDDFLEWFVKNPSCEFVEVEKEYKHFTSELYDYKIIIPKEEPTDFLDIVTKEFFKLMDLKEENKQEPKQELERGITITHVGKQETPTELDSVLAKITHINDLGVSEWYEVVYYADDKWCSYNGSKTFEDGERVIEWKYCKDCL